MQWQPSWISDPHRNESFVRDYPVTFHVQLGFNQICCFCKKYFIYFPVVSYVKLCHHKKHTCIFLRGIFKPKMKKKVTILWLIIHIQFGFNQVSSLWGKKQHFIDFPIGS
jgi:hypothetical protein